MKRNNLEDTAEYRFGDGTQQEWGRIMAKQGHCVLPVYGLKSNNQATVAPMLLFGASGVLVAPDLLVMGSDGESMWNEVKGKTMPTWRRCPPGPRWEHGFDFSFKREYKEVQFRSGIDLYIVILEPQSPADPEHQSELSGPATWLWISLDEAIDAGEHRPKWPGGDEDPTRRGRDGLGGWLWARSAMQMIRADKLFQSLKGREVSHGEI